MFNKKLIVNGNLEIAESGGGFTPCLIMVGPKPLDTLIAEHVGIKKSGREHALQDNANHYLGHVQITIEPVYIVCPGCGDSNLNYDHNDDIRGRFLYDCLACGISFDEDGAKNTRWLTVADVQDRCNFISMTNKPLLRFWAQYLEMNVGVKFGNGGIYSRWDLDLGGYAEIYLTESDAPRARDRVFPYLIVVDRTDQNDEPVPADLVIMPTHDKLDVGDFLNLLFFVPWYECEGVLLVSGAEINNVTTLQPADAGIDIVASQIFKIDESLKNFDNHGGFSI